MIHMENKFEQSKVPFISKLAYGMGDVGCNFSWMFVGNFLMIFYTDVFGVFALLGCHKRSYHRRVVRQDKNTLGKIPSLASVWSPTDGIDIDTDLLGTSRME